MIKEFEKHNALSWLITILIAISIFYFSSLSFTEFGRIRGNWMSILYHILAFFFLSLFLFISLLRGKRNWKLMLFASLIVLSYGIIDEIHQFFVPGRFSTLFDIGVDLMGIVFALMIYLISLIYRKSK